MLVVFTVQSTFSHDFPPFWRLFLFLPPSSHLVTSYCFSIYIIFTSSLSPSSSNLNLSHLNASQSLFIGAGALPLSSALRSLLLKCFEEVSSPVLCTAVMIFCSPPILLTFFLSWIYLLICVVGCRHLIVSFTVTSRLHVLLLLAPDNPIAVLISTHPYTNSISSLSWSE